MQNTSSRSPEQDRPSEFLSLSFGRRSGHFFIRVSGPFGFRFIGDLHGDTLHKRVRKKHLFNVCSSIGFSSALLMRTLFSMFSLFAMLNLYGDPQDQGSVAEYVIDSLTVKPIGGALAVIGEYRYAWVSNDKGSFLISGTLAGTYLFPVEYKCYRPWTLYHLEVIAGNRTELNIALSDPSRFVAEMQPDSVVIHLKMQFYRPDSLNEQDRIRNIDPDRKLRYR
jgi:hypothetical protein